VQKCVARYNRDTKSILCGKPNISWSSPSDILTEEAILKRKKAGLCQQCFSYKKATELAKQKGGHHSQSPHA
jgi:hypothetical protein